MNCLRKLLFKLRYLRIFGILTFDKIRERGYIYLYAGDIPFDSKYRIKGIVGLSVNRPNYQTILHDITKKYPLPDNSVDCYQAEDVFEHINYDNLPFVINEIYRILKPGGYLRVSVPDYNFDLYRERSTKDEFGNIIYDKFGGGYYENGQVKGGGHLWFPTYSSVRELVGKTMFKQCIFYHYYDENLQPVTNRIDYSKGYIQRTPDNDERAKNPYRPMSIVCDLIKD